MYSLWSSRLESIFAFPLRSSFDTKFKLPLWFWNLSGRLQWLINSSRQPEGRLRTQERKGTVERYGAYLIVIWNSRFRPLKGLHTFAASRSPDGWEVFNRFNNDETSRHYARLDDMLRGGESPGAFLLIYRVRRLEERS